MRLGPISQRGVPMASISRFNAGVSGVGEWMKRPLSSRRMTVIRVGNTIFGHGKPKRIPGPSTIHTSLATGFSVLRGGR